MTTMRRVCRQLPLPFDFAQRQESTKSALDRGASRLYATAFDD